MRRMLVVLVWVVATVGVTYVANAAVELVDLQVFPQGARIEVLARAQPTPTTLPRMRATTTATAPATTVAVPVMTVSATTTTTTTTTTMALPATTTTVSVATTVASTTTVAAVATTTAAPPVATTTRPPTTTKTPPTTTLPLVTTTTVAPVELLQLLEQGWVELKTGTIYQSQLVSGGVEPYALSVVSGAMPESLELDDNGFLHGDLEDSGLFEAVVEVVDSTGQTATGTVSFVVKEFRIVAARGGSVTVVVVGGSVEFFSALQGLNFGPARVIRSGPIVVEVSFVPKVGDDTSWVRCEVVEDVVCSHG